MSAALTLDFELKGFAFVSSSLKLPGGRHAQVSQSSCWNVTQRRGGGGSVEMDFKTFVEIIDVYVQCRVK